MNEQLAQRVRAAAVALWQAILIAVIWLTVGWGIWLVMLHYQPEWLLWCWGRGDLDWDAVQTVIIWFFGAFKLILFAHIMVALWLTFWARRLKRIA